MSEPPFEDVDLEYMFFIRILWAYSFGLSYVDDLGLE